jgi:gamma-glutamylcyclotransferase (GGCT)/AIG2-like uncharacterized protein YtfP
MGYSRSLNKDIQFPINLFVYGTLKTGGRFNEALGLQGTYHGDAILQGYKLGDIIPHTHTHKVTGINLNYPVMQEESEHHHVVGEILVIDNVIDFAEIYRVEEGYELTTIDSSDIVEGNIRDLPTYTFLYPQHGGYETERVVTTYHNENGKFTVLSGWLLT